MALLLIGPACDAPAPPGPAAHGGAADASEDGGSGGETSAEVDTGAPPAGGPEDGAVTYHRDVRPLLERSCVGCHQDGEIAPFPLTTYDEVWPLREAIVQVVKARTMPPWLPGPGCNEYDGDPSLSAHEIETFTGWAADDGPRGDEADAPPPPPPPTGGLSRVDLEVPLPVAYTPVSSPDDYRCFLVDWPQSETTYVTGFAALPDRREEVHHVIVYAVDADQVAGYEALDAADPDPGYPCFGGPGGTSLSAAGRWLGAWAPGGRGNDYPEGVGLRMEPASKIVVQLHYNTLVAEPAPDRTAVRFRLDQSVEREGFMLLWADPDWLGGNMPIPAGAASTVHSWALDPTLVMDFLTDVIPAQSPFLLYSASHHMHQLGVGARSEIQRADGSTDCLLDIPRWDFDWQKGHGLATPLRFDPGDVLKLRCEFDNADGDTEVNWGDGTADEMCLGVYFIASP